MKKTPLFFIAILLLFSCRSQKSLLDLPTFSTVGTVNCIIEIPAGTNKKIEFNKISNKFEIDRIEGVDRIKNYLPYPANYGFIPSTYSDLSKGGDGDPIDVFLLCESLPTGTVVEAYPIAILRLIDEGQMDDKIICIPANEELQVMKPLGFFEFNKQYPEALEIIKTWIAHNDTSENTVINGWANEKDALAEIKKLAFYFKESKQ